MRPSLPNGAGDDPDEACGVVAGPEGSDRPERFIPMINAAGSPTFYEFESRSTSLASTRTWMLAMKRP